MRKFKIVIIQTDFSLCHTMKLFLLCCFSVLHYVSSLPLPNYIKPCRYSDPNFTKCAIEAATKALPFVTKGDKKYGVVSSMPLIVPEVVLSSPNMVLTLRNIHIDGLADSIFKDIRFDPKNKKGRIVTYVEDTIYNADYEIDGHILVLPIKGSGKANIVLHGGTYEYDFEIQIYKKNGVEYAKLVNPTVNYTLKRVKYQLDNLFNGDKRLGDELNKVLNENWEVVDKDMSSSFRKTNAEICFAIANAYFARVPLKDWFLDESLVID